MLTWGCHHWDDIGSRPGLLGLPSSQLVGVVVPFTGDVFVKDVLTDWVQHVSGDFVPSGDIVDVTQGIAPATVGCRVVTVVDVIAGIVTIMVVDSPVGWWWRYAEVVWDRLEEQVDIVQCCQYVSVGLSTGSTAVG